MPGKVNDSGKPLEELSDDQILDPTAAYMGRKHQDKLPGASFEEAKERAKQNMSKLPISHVKIMLEKFRKAIRN